MAAGSVAWLIGNLLWLSGRPVFLIVLWWAGFLILTVAGERLELGRLTRLTKRIERLFLAGAALFSAGLILSVYFPGPGTRLAGLGMLSLAAWLLRWDIARRTIRQKGLPRFAAACLLSGYIWLGTAGILALINGFQAAGLLYDAMLHAVFVGFIFSMIFGHAPIIFPAIFGTTARFHATGYVYLILLHLSMLLRIAGDLAGYHQARLWGGLIIPVLHGFKPGHFPDSKTHQRFCRG
jgi:hypothetical protein